jgi:hypothetical protein
MLLIIRHFRGLSLYLDLLLIFLLVNLIQIGNELIRYEPLRLLIKAIDGLAISALLLMQRHQLLAPLALV